MEHVCTYKEFIDTCKATIRLGSPHRKGKFVSAFFRNRDTTKAVLKARDFLTPEEELIRFVDIEISEKGIRFWNPDSADMFAFSLVEKDAEFYNNFEDLFPWLKAKKGVGKVVPHTPATTPTKELWWQKADREKREQKAAIVQLYADIRHILFGE